VKLVTSFGMISGGTHKNIITLRLAWVEERHVVG